MQRSLFRSIPLALLLGVIAALTASAADPGDRDLRVAQAIVEAFNEPDDASRRELLQAVLGGDSERTAHIATALAFLASRHGRVSVDEIAESTATWASIVLEGEQDGDYLTLRVEYESADGEQLGSVGFRPGRPADRAPAPVSETAKAEIVQALAGYLREDYVLPEQRERLADAVEAWAPEQFAEITESTRFAEALTRELRRLQDDKHLAVFDPASAAGRWEGPGEPNERQDDAGHGHDLPGQEGFGKVEVLAGNIGFIEVLAFDGSSAGIDRLGEIMRSLGEVDAMVIDLRGSRGGEPGMVIQLSSYFFSEPTLLATSVSPMTDGPTQRWTRALPNSRLADVQLYLLTSRMTASAAESFVFGLRRNKRVTLVGERTAGAGHLADVRRLPGGFGLQLPVGRTYDPESGLGWEGVGIEPDIVTEPSAALEVALSRIEGAGE